MDTKQLQPVVEFMWNLYRNSSSASKTSSVFLSPLSIVNVLCMTYMGAAGSTKDQLRDVMFGTTAKEDQIQNLFTFLTDLLSAGKERDKGYKLSAASRLYCQSGFEILKSFTDQLEKLFKSDMTLVNFADSEKSRSEINSWVSSRTNGKIDQLIQPGILNDLTKLVLVNAVYFKGDWAVKFQTNRTIEAPFYLSASHHVQIPMMTDKRKFHYTEDEDCQVLSIAYKGNELALYIVLPKKRFQMEQFESKLTGQHLQQLFYESSTCEVTVTIPKFKLEHSLRVKPTLEQLGLTEMFDCSKANFSEMSKNSQLCVSEFLHKAFVEVNEEGTEAAAASAAVIMNRAAFVQERDIYFLDCDRMVTDTSEKVLMRPLALLKILQHAKEGAPLEVMGLLMGSFDDKYTVTVTDAVNIPQVGTKVSVEDTDANYQTHLADMLKKAGYTEQIVGWYHSHPGLGCWLSGEDMNTQMNLELFCERAIAVVVDPFQNGNGMIEAFRLINPVLEIFGIGQRETTSNATLPKMMASHYFLRKQSRCYYALLVEYSYTDIEKEALLSMQFYPPDEQLDSEEDSTCSTDSMNKPNFDSLQILRKIMNRYKTNLCYEVFPPSSEKETSDGSEKSGDTTQEFEKNDVMAKLERHTGQTLTEDMDKFLQDSLMILLLRTSLKSGDDRSLEREETKKHY
ncbi:hypothetical protein M514_21351, partial [Trichuris suis]